MKKILLLSDTHSYIDERIIEYAKNTDEIWHCGDFGNIEIINELEKITVLRGVYGNIDNSEIRKIFPEILRFTCEKIKILMVHIGGYPFKYSPLAKKEIQENPPDLFISGHSHILKVMYDDKNKLLHLNPGAAGKYGWHKIRTMMRFKIFGEKIENLEVIELEKR
jgi:putative phosphoesterase